MWRRVVILFVFALLPACSPGLSRDVVIYKAAPARIDGELHSRSLLIAGTGEAIGVDRTIKRDLRVRTGLLAEEEWEAIRSALVELRGVREDDAGGAGSGTFQVWARLGALKIGFSRDPAEPMADGVARFRARMEGLWDGLPPAEDPVAVLLPFTTSHLAHVRGQVAQALLIAKDSPMLSAGQRERALAAVRGMLRTEDDQGLVQMLRDGLEE